MNQKNHLEKLYNEAIDYLDDNYAYFLTHVLNIGKPKFTNSVPTAAVSVKLDKSKDKLDYSNFDFLFSPDFFQKLDTETCAFVMAHETMHIILNHLKLGADFYDTKKFSELHKKEQDNERLTRDELKDLFVIKQQQMKFNIAADCVINDYLDNGGFNVDGFKAPDGKPAACRGEYFIGENAAYMTVHEVYARLENQQQSGSGGEGEIIVADGSVGEYKEMDNHNWIFDPDFADKMADAIDKFNDEIEKDMGLPQSIEDKKNEEQGKLTRAQEQMRKQMQAGTEQGNMREFQEQHGLQLGWVHLLKEIDPDMFKEPGIAPPMLTSFHRRPRKLGDSSFKKLNMPVYRKDERIERKTKEVPAIVMALDTSGSIGPRDADRFITLARSIPQDRIKIFACTFTTNYIPLDLENPHSGGSGGTSFDPIVHFIDKVKQENLKGKYPKAVVVITDGAAHLSDHLAPSAEEAKSWYWLISPQDSAGYGYDASVKIGRRDMLDKFIV